MEGYRIRTLGVLLPLVPCVISSLPAQYALLLFSMIACSSCTGSLNVP